MARRRAMMGTVVAIVVSGPQATGKTTLAMALGTALSIPVFSRDPLMRALQASLPWPVTRHGPWVPATGLGLQTALLARQLELGVHRAARGPPGVAADVPGVRLSLRVGGMHLPGC